MSSHPSRIVANHRELGGEVFGLDGAIHHPVGLELDGELKVLVAGRQGLEVVGTIRRCRAVELTSRSFIAPGMSGWSGVPLNTMCSSRWAMPVSP